MTVVMNCTANSASSNVLARGFGPGDEDRQYEVVKDTGNEVC